MIYHFRKIKFGSVQNNGRVSVVCRRGFSLPEVIAALIILSIICSSVFVVIDRCVESSSNSLLKMRAFEVARENMEMLLTSDEVEEKVEFGNSERYPDIQWENNVEMFYEPITSRAWMQAICTAEYIDADGQVQTVELTHWLTDISKKQMLEMLEEKQKSDQNNIDPNLPSDPNEIKDPNGDPNDPKPEGDCYWIGPDETCYSWEELNSPNMSPSELFPIILGGRPGPDYK